MDGDFVAVLMATYKIVRELPGVSSDRPVAGLWLAVIAMLYGQ